MTITVTTLTEAEFYTKLRVFIGQVEGTKEKPYLDTSTLGGIRHTTIGIGFDLVDDTVRDRVFNAMGVPTGVRAALTNIIDNPPSSDAALRSQLDAAYGQPFVMTDAQIDQVYKQTVQAKVDLAITKSGLPYSDELIALSSLQFNGLYGSGLQAALDISDPHEARAEAWYQIRYAHATNQNESRRYSEASIFGLYESPSGPVSKEEAVGIYKMYTKHYSESYDNNGGMISYDNAKSNDIGLSNGDLSAMGAAFSGYSTQKLELELRRAANTIETEYLKPNNLSLGSINPLNIQISYDGKLDLTGEDTTTRTGYIDDLLIGDANGNTLEGKSGNDILLGGQGNDTYIYNQGDGFDTIIDTDGSINYDNVLLSGGKQYGDMHVHRDNDKHLYVDIGYGLVVDGNILIKDYQPGNLNINLTGPEAEPQLNLNPETIDPPILGDFEPLDADPNTDGVQSQPDPWGNLIPDPNKPKPDQADTLYDTPGNDHIMSGGGDDIITAQRGGNDLIEAGTGKDTIDAGTGNDVIKGGAGDDTLKGGIGDDIILGEADRDKLTGGEGKDILMGGADGDILSGGADDDKLYADVQVSVAAAITQGNSQTGSGLKGEWLSGEVGDDTLIGDTGNDVLAGGSGNDLLIGGAGDDDIIGDANWVVNDFNWTVTTTNGQRLYNGAIGNMTPADFGADVVYAGKGNDYVWTGEGNDVIFGEDGNDTLNGEKGNDIISGGDGIDIVNGQQGDDVLLGGTGNDFLIGGSGHDTFIINANEGSDTLIDSDKDSTLIFGVGVDESNITLRLGSSLMLDLGNGNTVHINGFDQNDVFNSSSVNSFSFADGTVLNINQLLARGFDLDGTSLDNTIFGTNTTDRINGLAGNDILVSGTGDDSLFGGTGIDLLLGGDGNDTIDGGDGDDLSLINGNTAGDGGLAGGAGDDTIYGGAGKDELDGGEGNDLLDGGTGDDLFFGGAGNDTLIGGAGADYFDGGAGNDTYRDLESLERVQDTNGNDTLVFQDASGLLAATQPLTLINNGTGLALKLDNGKTIFLLDVFFGSHFTLQFGNGTTIDLESLIANTLSTAVNLQRDNTNGRLYGGAANDTLRGGTGDNTIIGYLGNDTLIGGAGNDVYVVDNTLDVVTEAFNEGTDTVQSGVTYTLGINVENLTLTGTAAINGTGNALNNVLTGNSAANTLSGGTGADTLIGGAGNDNYVVDNTLDVVNENLNEGADLVQSSVTYTLAANVENLTLTGTSTINGTGNILDNVLTGNSAANTLVGDAGNDRLVGGAGIDTMRGGTGNDTYVVDVATDIVTENANEGIDTVESSKTLTLAANVENLLLTGATAIKGTGNTLNNLLTGNSAVNTLTGGAGNDRLDGKAGADKLLGGTGDDTYVVDIPTDVITENTNEGADTVETGITYTLGANVENLSLTGATAINGTGNTLNNVLMGNSAANTLNGGAGNDTLSGGAGADNFVFNTALNAATNKDTLFDFSVVDDTIKLENAIFTKFTTTGALSAGSFVSGAGAVALDSNDYLIYNTANGRLYYDADGSGAGVQVEFVMLTGIPPITAADFAII